MKNLIWAEWKKLRRSSIVLFTVIATILIAAFVLFAGQSVTIEGYYLNDPGWYMTMVQPWATILVLPAMISMLGSYMICREEQDDTLKSLLLIPLNETALTAAKMIVTFVLSVLIHLLLFVITLSTELILHYSNLSIGMVLSFFKSYLLEGVGVFLAVSPIIALVSYTKKSYWLALLLAEIYSFAGLFMSMSNLTRSFYPITGLLGVAGYYETTTANLIGSIIILLACGCLAVFILLLHRHAERRKAIMANKLRKSRDNRWFAGVCGGLAEYFGVSPKIVRIICALLIMVYGSGLMVYIILAIFIPKEPKR